MSYTTIYFLLEADDFDQAESRVTAYLETEHFFDYFIVLPESSGLLNKKRNELLELLEDRDWRKSANSFLELAEKHKSNEEFCLYGYYLIKAGELFAQCLTIASDFFNIDTGDYSIPKNDINQWMIAVDFHY